MGREFTSGKTEECTVENMKLIRNTVGECTDGLMEEFILEDGTRDNKMMKEFTSYQTEISKKPFGLTERKDHMSR